MLYACELDTISSLALLLSWTTSHPKEAGNDVHEAC